LHNFALSWTDHIKGSFAFSKLPCFGCNGKWPLRPGPAALELQRRQNALRPARRRCGHRRIRPIVTKWPFSSLNCCRPCADPSPLAWLALRSFQGTKASFGCCADLAGFHRVCKPSWPSYVRRRGHEI
jgi:hypothetical protein